MGIRKARKDGAVLTDSLAPSSDHIGREHAPRARGLTAHHSTPVLGWQAARLWAVAVCFAAVAVARSLQVDIPFRDPHGTFLLGRVLQALWLVPVFVGLDGILRCGRPHSIRNVWSTVRTRWSLQRFAFVWVALPAYWLTYFSYRNLKSWDVFNAPRDAMLTSWDRALFLGHSPAVLLHDLLGQHLAARVLMVWYESFPTLVMVAVPAAVVLTRRMRDGYAGMAALMWIWILGTATYYLIPSLGPFHAEPGDFAGLPHTMIQATQDRYIAQRDHLLAHPHDPGVYAQVSAFASLHVGVTATILGLAWWHRLRRTTIALTIYLTGTIVATIYLGWHFAVDIPAGLAIAVLAWILGPLSVGVRRRPPHITP